MHASIITSQDMFKGCFYQSGSRSRRDPDSLMLINTETKDVDVLTSIPFANLLSYSRKRLSKKSAAENVSIFHFVKSHDVHSKNFEML